LRINKGSFSISVALIAFGSLIGACGDGQITGLEEGRVGEPPPNQADLDGGTPWQDALADIGQPTDGSADGEPPAEGPPTFVGSAHPNMFLNSTEIAAVIAKIQAGESPWKEAYSSLISRANGYLTANTVSVTDGGPLGASGDKHIFATGNGYGGDRADYQAAHTLQKAVRTLALAYSLTGDAEYADKAIQYIYDWTTNPGTKMRPDLLEGLESPGQPRLDVSITLPGMYYGADLIWNYPGWHADEKAAFVDWVETLMNEYYKPAHGQCGNNWQDWKHLMYAASAVILQNEAYLEDAFSLFKEALPCKMNDDGRMEQEYTRGGNGGISYTLFSLNPMLQIAEIARHHGEDLYSYESGSKSLERGMDYVTPYCINPSSWPWQVGNWSPGGTDGVGAFELINFYKQKSSYVDFIDKSARPLFDIWITGDTTLTHASGAFPFKIWN
jgi:hypothetical protein